MTTTNNRRAREGNAALSTYLHECGGADLETLEGGNDQEAMAALIAALAHLCDAQGWDFEALVREGRDMYRGDMDSGDKADCDFAS